MKERDYLFDNLRAFLIFFVVLGHMLRENVFQAGFLYSIYTFVYLFHMAAFVFISGYFSKNTEKCRDNAFELLLIPFIILSILSYLKGMLLQELTEPLLLLHPLWGLWFFFALFTWRFLLKDIVKIRFILPISFIFGLLSGFTTAATEEMALGRIIAFLPFFLLGYYCNKDMIEKVKKIPKVMPIIILIFFFGFSILNGKYRLLSFESLYLRRSFELGTFPWYRNPALYERLFIYIAGILLTASFIHLMSSKHTVYSFIGQNSITVYMIHILLVPTLKRFSLFDKNPMLYFLYSLVITILITWIAALPFVKNSYDLIINWIKKLILKPSKSK